MLAKDNNKFWGLDTDYLVNKGKKYNSLLILVMLLNIFVVLIVVSIASEFKVTGVLYMFMVIFVLFWYIPVICIALRGGVLNTYRFYRKVKNLDVLELTYTIDTRWFVGVLHNAGCKIPLYTNSVDEYKKFILECCRKNSKFSNKLLSQLDNNAEDGDKLTFKVVTYKNKNYIIDIVDNK